MVGNGADDNDDNGVSENNNNDENENQNDQERLWSKRTFENQVQLEEGAFIDYSSWLNSPKSSIWDNQKHQRENVFGRLHYKEIGYDDLSPYTKKKDISLTDVFDSALTAESIVSEFLKSKSPIFDVAVKILKANRNAVYGFLKGKRAAEVAWEVGWGFLSLKKRIVAGAIFGTLDSSGEEKIKEHQENEHLEKLRKSLDLSIGEKGKQSERELFHSDNKEYEKQKKELHLDYYNELY